MKKKNIIVLICLFLPLLSSACGPTIRTIEVTRIVPQTVIATRLVTQVVPVNITTTPRPTGILTPTIPPSPKWTPAFTQTPLSLTMLTMTPGLQVIDNTTSPEVEKIVSTQYIKEYLVMNYGTIYFGGKVFCGYIPLGMGNDGHTIKLYLWIECAEYYLQDQVLKIGSGLDIPVVLFVELRHGEYKIVNFLDTGGGFQYARTNFPPEIQKIILSQDSLPEPITNGLTAVHQALKQEAEAYFGK